MATRSLAEMMADAGDQGASPAPATETRKSLSELMAEQEQGQDASAQILPEGRYSVRDRQWIPAAPVKAQFTDLPAGQQEITSKQLSRIRDDTLTRGRLALAGGLASGVTSGFADEAAGAGAAVTAPFRGESPVKAYRETRDEARKAMRDAADWDRKADTIGRLSGTALQVGLGIGAPKGAALLTAGNTGRAAAMGGAVGLGASEADLTKGEVLPATWDTAKGAALGVGANMALGLAGKGATAARNWVKNAPERAIKKADDALIDAVTLGAPASQRDALMGDLGMNRSDVLAAIKANPQLQAALKRGDRGAAAEIVMSAQRQHADRVSQYMGGLDQQGEIEVAPVIKRLEQHRDDLRKAGTLEGNFEADKVQKRIDAIEHQFMPPVKEPELRGDALASKLVAAGDSGTKERAAANAEDFGKVAEKYKLGKVADDLAARKEKIGSVLESLNEKTAKVYDGVIEKATRAAKIDVLPATGKVPSEPGYLYHSTDKSKLGDLAKNGLVKREPSFDENAPHSFLTTRASQAKNFAVDAKSPVIVRVKSDRATGLERQSGNWYAADTVSPKDVEVLTNKGWLPVRDLQYRSNPGEIQVGNITANLRGWADSLRKQAGGVRLKDADNIEAIAANMDQAAVNSGKASMTPKELRQLITDMQGKAFSGSYLDPTEARAMQRELAGKLREELDAHVAAHGSAADVKKLAVLNKQISALITFQESAERESVKAFEVLHKGAAPSVANVGTGKARPSQIYAVANGTEDPAVKRNVIGGLYDQLGPTVSRDITAMERQGETLRNLQAPLAHTAARDASPPTTLRSHARSLGESLKNAGTAGAVVAGTAATVASPPAGAAIIAGALAAKYGGAVKEAAERAAVTMEYAFRKGAQRGDLATIGRVAGLPASVTSDLIEAIAPREAARPGRNDGR